MYGGRYGLTRYSLRVGEWTVEVGGTFSDVLGGLVGGTLPVSVGAVFSEELGVRWLWTSLWRQRTG